MNELESRPSVQENAKQECRSKAVGRVAKAVELKGNCMNQKYAEFHHPKFALLGAEIQFLAGPGEAGLDVGLIAGGMPVGRLAPLHSHESAETICVIEGVIELYRETDGWTQVEAGEVILIPSNVKHALRNSASQDMKSIFVTDATLYKYFKEVCEPFPIAGPPRFGEQLEAIFAANRSYGYWLGSPEDNAAIGIKLPQIPH